MLPVSSTTPHWLCGLLLDIWTAERVTCLMCSPVTAVFHTSSLQSDPRLLITSAFDLAWPCWLVYFRCPTEWTLVLKNNRSTFCSLIALMIHAPVGLEASAVKTTIWTIERDRHVHMLFSAVSLSLVSCLWCLAALWSEPCAFVCSGVCVFVKWIRSYCTHQRDSSFCSPFRYCNIVLYSWLDI